MTKSSVKKAAPAKSFKAKIAATVKTAKKAPKPGPVVLKPKTIAKKIVARAKVAAAKPEPPAPKPARKISRVQVSKDQKARKAAQKLYEAQSDARLRALAKKPKTAAAEPGDAEESPAQRTVKLVPADIRLLRDPSNGITLLQLEKTSPAGAVCVYNNGTRVAAGVVGEDTLRFVLRPEPGSPSITEAAYQLLNPVVPSVQVTETAAAHLTAVLNSKEIAAMSVTETTEAPVAKSKKFAAPVVKPAKAKKVVDPAPPAKKAAAKKSAAKADKTPAKKAAKKSEPAEATTGIRVTKSKFDGLKFKVDKDVLAGLKEGSKAQVLAKGLSARKSFERTDALPDRATADKAEWNAAVTQFEVAVRSGLFVQL